MKQSNLVLKEEVSEIKNNFLFNEDVWKAEDIGLNPDRTHSSYYLNFKRLQPEWFKETVKRFICYQASTKTYNTCRSYISGLTHFGNFISYNYDNFIPEKLDRSTILSYLTYLNSGKLQATAKNIALIHLRNFITTAKLEEWLPFPNKILIYDQDIPKPSNPIPRFIPEEVMMRLQKNLKSLPIFFYRLIFVLLETGRRINEICTLPYNCIKQDEEKDYLLEVYESKTKKAYLIPISKNCANVIFEQQEYLKEIGEEKNEYLFPSKKTAKAHHASARHIHELLNQLARTKNIKDANGKIWKFSAHQFRHTVGTRMINAGVSQFIVQRYLGHETPEMTSRYAYIHNQTMKKVFSKFQNTIVDIQGTLLSDDEINAETRWLKHNIMAQALPNGFCALPSVQNRCPHANACLTCANFRTNKSFLSQHKKQLSTTNNLIGIAEKKGWKKQLEMHNSIKTNLEKIINTLEN